MHKGSSALPIAVVCPNCHSETAAKMHEFHHPGHVVCPRCRAKIPLKRDDPIVETEPPDFRD